MKKIIILFLALVLLCAGCSGNTAENVSRTIDSIGTVRLSSGDAIVAAEQSYNRLSNSEREKVENYQVLVAARTRYNALVKANDELEIAAARIGPVTASSGEQLTSLRNRYDLLVIYNKPETFPDFEQRLISMEKEYEQCLIAQKFNTARNLLHEKKYHDALVIFQSLLSDPKAAEYHNPCNNLIIQCNSGIDKETSTAAQKLEEAQTLLKDKKPLEAVQVLDGINTAYRSDEYTQIRNEALDKLKANRPKNGKVLDRTLKSGKGVLKVTAEEGRDFLIKLESSGKYVIFYVRGGQTAKIKVPDGIYTIKYGTGDYWCDAPDYFYPSGTFTRPLEFLSFETTKTTYTQYNMNLSLSSSTFVQLGGNISADEF